MKELIKQLYREYEAADKQHYVKQQIYPNLSPFMSFYDWVDTNYEAKTDIIDIEQIVMKHMSIPGCNAINGYKELCDAIEEVQQKVDSVLSKLSHPQTEQMSKEMQDICGDDNDGKYQELYDHHNKLSKKDITDIIVNKLQKLAEQDFGRSSLHHFIDHARITGSTLVTIREAAEEISIMFANPESPVTYTGLKDNWNNYIDKNSLDKWHKVDKEKFVAPKDNTNIVFFSKSGNVSCGHYKGSQGFVVYGIGAKELLDCEITHWLNLKFPDDYQQMLDDLDKN